MWKRMALVSGEPGMGHGEDPHQACVCVCEEVLLGKKHRSV